MQHTQLEEGERNSCLDKHSANVKSPCRLCWLKKPYEGGPDVDGGSGAHISGTISRTKSHLQTPMNYCKYCKYCR